MMTYESFARKGGQGGVNVAIIVLVNGRESPQAQVRK
jgi:hypothetical protein